MKYHKLVRDKIPEIITADNSEPVTRTLNDDEYTQELDKKLGEELKEYLESGNIEELADLLEVIYAVASAKGSNREALEKTRRSKAARRGGFAKKIFLIETKER